MSHQVDSFVSFVFPKQDPILHSCQEFLGLPPVPGDVVQDGSDRISDVSVRGDGLERKRWKKCEIKMAHWVCFIWFFMRFFTDWDPMGFIAILHHHLGE